VAKLSASVTPKVVTPAIGQHPIATGEIWIAVLPNGRTSGDMVASQESKKLESSTPPNGHASRRQSRLLWSPVVAVKSAVESSAASDITAIELTKPTAAPALRL
jgi:hypothetical protein